MTIFATWIVSDQRFSFHPDEGEIKLTNARHTQLLREESQGRQLLPDPVTGVPIAVVRPGETSQEQITAYHAAKVREINEACETTITGGFTSSALGESYSYDSLLKDQLNLTGVVISGEDSPFPCRDQEGVKTYRSHSAEQLRQVSNDFTLYKFSFLQLANTLKKQLDQALEDSDLNALEMVTWESAQP